MIAVIAGILIAAWHVGRNGASDIVDSVPAPPAGRRSRAPT